MMLAFSFSLPPLSSALLKMHVIQELGLMPHVEEKKKKRLPCLSEKVRKSATRLQVTFTLDMKSRLVKKIKKNKKISLSINKLVD